MTTGVAKRAPKTNKLGLEKSEYRGRAFDPL